jgi:hypothetical protein
MPIIYEKSHDNGPSGIRRAGLLPVLLTVALIGVLWVSAFFLFDITSP